MIFMPKCAGCGRIVRAGLEFGGKDYGPECFKKYAVPEIEKLLAKRSEEERKRDAERKRAWRERCWILVQVLKKKDLRRIRNRFKLRVIPELIEQFETKGWLSKKQCLMVHEWLNDKDMLLMTDIERALGYYDGDDIGYYREVVAYAKGKRKKEAQEILERLERERLEREFFPEWREKCKQRLQELVEVLESGEKDNLSYVKELGSFRERLVNWAKWRIENIETMDGVDASDVELDIRYLQWRSLKRFVEKDGF
jgi:hypothetical protein